MIKLSDYVAGFLAERGVEQVFMVTGGGAMHLNDSFGKEGRLRVTCNHHEQASAMAAEGYARITGRPGVVNVTTGPGGINALNGVFGAWTDSVPMLIVSGQVKRETCMACCDVQGLRQLGDQEVDIIRMVSGITKYAVLVTDPESIRYHLEKALWLATHGRPGPCWIDIPVDVQAARIDETALTAYDRAENDTAWDLQRVRSQCLETLEKMRQAKRPVVLAGTGIRAAGATDLFRTVANRLGVPVATAWTQDVITSDDPLFCGRQGTIGDRAGNFTVQNADVLLVIGSRLAIRQVSYNWRSFAREAFKIQVDVDAAELRKPTVQPDLAIHCDAKIFLEELGACLDTLEWDAARYGDWLGWCKERVRRYPVVLPKHTTTNCRINPYHFIDCVYRALSDDDVVVCGDATACIVTFQVASIRGRQRLFSNSGSASMGYDLPAAIGAACAREGQRVICFAGDGSIQMNVQELQTIAHHRWPIKIFVLSNGGYLSIRSTQKNFFGHLVGESAESGVSFPDMGKVASAYGLPTARLEGSGFLGRVAAILSEPGPYLCEVVLDRNQTFEPKLSSKQLPDGRMVTAPLEDMYPFLDAAELRSNMVVPAPPSAT